MTKKEKKEIVERFIARDLADLADPENYNPRDVNANHQVAICCNPATGQPDYDILDGTAEAVHNHAKHNRPILRVRPGASPDDIRDQIRRHGRGRA